MCAPFHSSTEPTIYGVTWRQLMYGPHGHNIHAPAVRRKPVQPEPQGSRIVPRKVPGMEDHMSILDRFFPSRRRRREEERRRADALSQRQVSPDTSPDLATLAGMAALASWGFSSGDSGGGSFGGSGE